MGGVYMGRDKMLDRPVAVKVMQKEFGADVEFVEKFKREAQSAAKLIHPNIAQVYSYGICDGMPYIAMELAAGGSLYSIMNANPGKTDVARVIKICQQVAQALQCASDQGFVHGDVKPENILLDSNGNAKLVDFGLAGMQKDTDEIWGTPYYISPEKVKKESVDFRTDMYSLGGTLYHALTGVAPFEGTDSIAVVKKRFEGMPRKPSEIRPELTPAIDDLVMRMLALNKEERYPSFEALLDAFKSVLSTGLTASVSSSTTTAPAKKPVAVGGARRMTAVRGRRAAMMKRPGATIKKTADGAEGGVAALDASPNLSDDGDEDEGGSVGLKVVGVIVGSILLIGGVIGGLVWYQVADRKARAAEERSQIVGGIEKARSAIAETVNLAVKFADEFDTFAARALDECQKPTDQLKKIIPEEQGAQLKPGPTRELLDAIASTNEAPKAAASATTNAADVAATATPVANAPIAKKTAKKLPQFRPPTEDEMDPASPEGEKYLAEKKAWEAEQLKKLKEGPKGQEAPAASAESTESADSEAKPEEKKGSEATAEVVIAMNELWERAYGCQACAIRIRQAVRALQRKSDEALELKADTREHMDKLVDLSRTLVDMFDKIKTSKDVETVRKGITYIKSKGGKTVEQTVKRLRIEKLEAERKAKAEAAAAAEKARLEKLAEDRKAKVEEETSGAKATFDAVVTRGDIRQLDWTKALRTLKDKKDSSTTPEGQLAYDLEIRKVNDMKSVHDLFIKNVKGHVFRGKLAKCKVIEASENELVVLKPDGKSKTKILWRTFYKDYPGNLNELINTYVFNARNTSAKVKLSLRDWADAMTGAALTMQLVCGEVNGALERSEALVKEVVKHFPDYQKTAQDIFPDIKFEDAKEE